MHHPEHHIQRDILYRLCFNKELRFSDLKPENLENNIFMYHLKQLTKAGLVIKNEEGLYTLAPNGMAYIDKLNYSTKQQSIQPKVVCYLQITDAHGTQLYWRRKIQPSIGYVGVPVGKIQYGEDVQRAAQRELTEKTGLTNVKLVYRGTANLKFYVSNSLVSHILTLVYTGKVNSVEPEVLSSEFGDVFWSNEEVDNVLESVYFIKDQLSAHPHGYFFAEQDFYL